MKLSTEDFVLKVYIFIFRALHATDTAGVLFFGVFQRHFSKGDSPSENSPSGASHMCQFPSGNFPKVGLGLVRWSSL